MLGPLYNSSVAHKSVNPGGQSLQNQLKAHALPRHVEFFFFQDKKLSSNFFKVLPIMFLKALFWPFFVFLHMHVYTGRQCNQPMGLQSGRLKNRFVTASSQWDKYHAAFLARLHWQRRGRYMGAWSARHNNRYQWLQLDFGRWAKIIRLATQGRQDTDQWVTQYYMKHSLDGIRFVDYQERNTRKVGTQNQGSVKRDLESYGAVLGSNIL